jgi:hypothetical protein
MPTPESVIPADPQPAAKISRKKKIFFSVIIFLAIVIVIELMSEMALRGLALPFRPGKEEISPTSNVDWQPYQGYESIHPYLGYVYELTEKEMNSKPGKFYGFENASVDEIQHRSPDTVIVGIFGGSVADKFAHSGIKSLEQALRAYRPFSRKKFIFISLALGGYKQPQQFFTLAYFLSLGSEFDLAINIDGFNDVILPVENNIPVNVFPYYPRSWSMRLPSPQSELIRGEVAYLNQKRQEWRDRYLSTPLSRSRTVTLLWALYDRNLAEKVINRQQIVARIVPQTFMSGSTFVLNGPKFKYQDDAAMWTDLSDFWARGSRQMQLLAKANGIKYFHFLQPNQYLPGTKPMDETERARVLTSPNYAKWVPVGYAYLKQAGQQLKEQGINFHDLTNIFATVNYPLYVDDCCHVSDRGSEILGQEIGKLMVEDLKAGR